MAAELSMKVARPSVLARRVVRTNYGKTNAATVPTLLCLFCYDPLWSPFCYGPVPSWLYDFAMFQAPSLTPKELSKLSKREDEWRSRLEKRDMEWAKKLEKREIELNKLMEEKETEWRKQEQKMTEDLLRQTRELKDALKMAEDSKRKICQYQEDKDQLEGFQTQEIAKLKHLLQNEIITAA
ncbi:GRIP domain [Homalodisca vitripennis]|nr:GRIP domain [Homalodisca vitripennis]